MKTNILLRATKRSIGYREWGDALFQGRVARFTYGVSQMRPKLGGFWFMWYIHEHRGGMGGLSIELHKAEIRENVGHLMKHQPENRS